MLPNQQIVNHLEAAIKGHEPVENASALKLYRESIAIATGTEIQEERLIELRKQNKSFNWKFWRK